MWAFFRIGSLPPPPLGDGGKRGKFALLGFFRCHTGGVTLHPRAMLTQEAIQWPDEVEILIDQLESEASERDLTRDERALIDVYETIPFFESEDCLHEFWQTGLDYQRVINSFERIGASAIVDPLNASRWCETRPEDRNDYNETEAEHLASIEEELFAGLDDLVDLVMDFVEEELD